MNLSKRELELIFKAVFEYHASLTSSYYETEYYNIMRKIEKEIERNKK